VLQHPLYSLSAVARDDPHMDACRPQPSEHLLHAWIGAHAPGRFYFHFHNSPAGRYCQVPSLIHASGAQPGGRLREDLQRRQPIPACGVDTILLADLAHARIESRKIDTRLDQRAVQVEQDRLDRVSQAGLPHQGCKPGRVSNTSTLWFSESAT